MPLKIRAQVLTYGASWSDALITAQLVDELGYDYLWGRDHLYSTGGDPYQPFFEGWATPATKRLVGEVKPLVDAGTG